VELCSLTCCKLTSQLLSFLFRANRVILVALTFLSSRKNSLTTTKVQKLLLKYPEGDTRQPNVPVVLALIFFFDPAREAELRQLRKSSTDYESQNASLGRIVESLRSAVSTLEADTATQRSNNAALSRHLDQLRSSLTTAFQGLLLPGKQRSAYFNHRFTKELSSNQSRTLLPYFSLRKLCDLKKFSRFQISRGQQWKVLMRT